MNFIPCLYTLIEIEQDPTLCNFSNTTQECFLNQALIYNDPNLCEYSPDNLRCIVTLSLEFNEEYCSYVMENETQVCLNSLDFYEDVE